MTEVENPIEVNPLISVHIGITIPGPQEYSSIRTDVEFRNINALFDIEPQLEKCTEVAKQTYAAVEKQLAEQAANISTLGIEGGSDFEERLARLDKLIGFIIEEAKRQKTIVDKLVPATAKKATKKTDGDTV